MTQFDFPKSLHRISETIAEAGGQPFLVGGCVRDGLLGRTVKDFDLEVYRLPSEALLELLRKLGPVETVGEAFRVYKITTEEGGLRHDIDVSLPRREVKNGRGHRGFLIDGDPSLSIEEAARRRDFTINAILWDPLTEEIVDPYRGRFDLERKVLRVVDPRTFPEDSLRVLRAVQLAARFELQIDSETRNLCRSIDLDDLPQERIWAEFEKLFLLAPRPSIGLSAALDLLVIDKLLPELKAMVGCEQDPEWHPEGDVWTHTLLAVDNGANFAQAMPRERRLIVILGVLLHDIAKPQTTIIQDGHVRSPGHEEGGIPLASRILDRLNVHRIANFDVRGQVLALVGNHLKPSSFYKERERITDAAFRRLSRKCDQELLYLVSKSDAMARGPASGNESEDWFIAKARALGVASGPPRPLLLGRHLLELGLAPGPRVGEILRAVYELQLDGRVETLEQAIAEARRLLAQES